MFGRITRNRTLGLVYTGSNLAMCIDAEEAVQWYKVNSKQREYEVIFLGTKYAFLFPDSDRGGSDSDVTKELMNTLVLYRNIKLIDDKLFSCWKEVLKKFDIYRNTDGGYYLKNKTAVTDQFENNEDLATLILMKEHLDGYHNTNPFTIKYEKQRTTVNLDTKFERPDPRYPDKMITIEGDYSAGLRYALFSKVLEMYNLDPRNKEKRDKLLQSRQYQTIKMMGSRTCLVCPRRSGKTLFMAYLILRAMLMDNPKRYIRPTTILFLGLSTNHYQAIIDYIDTMLTSLDALGRSLFEYKQKDNTYYLKDADGNVIAQTRFLTAEGKLPGVGYFADYVFIDECQLISDPIYRAIEPIITHEGARFFGASTLYADSKEDGWFSQLTATYEKQSMEMLDIDNIILDHWDRQEPFEHYAGLRFNIDDLEIISEKKKEEIKEMYSNDPNRYSSELYSVRAETEKCLKYDRRVKEGTPEENNPHKEYDVILHAYDPAKTHDKSAFVSVGLDRKNQKAYLLRTTVLNPNKRDGYLEQSQKIKEVLEVYKGMCKSQYVIMDGTHDGVYDYMISVNIPVYRNYKVTGGQAETKGSHSREFKVPKKLFVNAAKMMLDNGKVELYSTQQELMQELDAFVEFVDPQTGNRKFQGVGSHDDLVFGFLMAMYCIYEDFGLKYNIGGTAWSVPKQTAFTVAEGETIRQAEEKAIQDRERRLYYSETFGY